MTWNNSSAMNATKSGVRTCTACSAKLNFICDWATISPEVFNNLMWKFYAEDRIPTPSFYTGLMAAIHRHTTSSPYNHNMRLCVFDVGGGGD